MPTWVSRIFLAIDEWLSIAWLTYLWKTQDPLFWKVLPLALLFVYGVGYPVQMWRENQAEKYRKSLIDR